MLESNDTICLRDSITTISYTDYQNPLLAWIYKYNAEDGDNHIINTQIMVPF